MNGEQKKTAEEWERHEGILKKLRGGQRKCPACGEYEHTQENEEECALNITS